MIPLPRPLRKPREDCRPGIGPGFTYDEPHEGPNLRGGILFLVVIAVWWGIDWLVRTL